MSEKELVEVVDSRLNFLTTVVMILLGTKIGLWLYPFIINIFT